MLTKIKLESSIFNEIYSGSMFTFDYKESFSKGTYLLIEEMDKCGVMLDRFCIVKVLYSMEFVLSKFQNNKKIIYIIAVDIKSGFRPNEINQKSSK